MCNALPEVGNFVRFRFLEALYKAFEHRLQEFKPLRGLISKGAKLVEAAEENLPVFPFAKQRDGRDATPELEFIVEIGLHSAHEEN